jgi:hypothetical protein
VTDNPPSEQIVKLATLLRYELAATVLAHPVPLEPDEEKLLPRTHSHSVLRAADAVTGSRAAAAAHPPPDTRPTAPCGLAPVGASTQASWEFDAPPRNPAGLGIVFPAAVSSQPPAGPDSGRAGNSGQRVPHSSGSVGPLNGGSAAGASHTASSVGRSYASWGSDLPVRDLAGNGMRIPSFMYPPPSSNGSAQASAPSSPATEHSARSPPMSGNRTRSLSSTSERPRLPLAEIALRMPSPEPSDAEPVMEASMRLPGDSSPTRQAVLPSTNGTIPAPQTPRLDTTASPSGRSASRGPLHAEMFLPLPLDEAASPSESGPVENSIVLAPPASASNNKWPEAETAELGQSKSTGAVAISRVGTPLLPPVNSCLPHASNGTVVGTHGDLMVASSQLRSTGGPSGDASRGQGMSSGDNLLPAGISMQQAYAIAVNSSK